MKSKSPISTATSKRSFDQGRMKSMWRTVARLEWRILRRDRAAVAVLGLFAGFLLLAAFAGGRQAGTVAESLERARGAELQRFTELTKALTGLPAEAPLRARDPRDPDWMGSEGAVRLAILPPAPLASVAVGQRDLSPQAIQVSSGVHLTEEREAETPMVGPTRLMTGAFDPAFLFVVLFPLVIIALSYELLSGERERGTLAMLLSQPVSQGALVFGKASARALALCVVTLAFALAGLLVAGAELALLPVLLYAAVLVAWALFWFAASIAVNAWGKSSASNALLLVGLWLLVVVVVPGLVTVAVETVFPPPSRIELLHEAREAAQDVEKKLAGLQGTHDRSQKAAGFSKRVVEVKAELAKRSTPVLTELREQLRRRQQLVDTLRFFSPAIGVQLALEDVAGSGATRHQRFEAQVDAYHERFRTWFYDKVRADVRLSPADLQAVPTFEYAPEPPMALVWRVSSTFVALLLGIGLLVWIATPGLRRIGRLAT